MSTQVAQEIGLIDDCFGQNILSFRQRIEAIAQDMVHSSDYEQRLALKRERRLTDERYKPLEDYRKEELEQMKLNFYSSDQTYHVTRRNFVYKITPSETPLHLAKHRKLGRVAEKCTVVLPNTKTSQKSSMDLLHKPS